MNNYNEIRQNLIEKFFNKNYRYSCVTCKSTVINDMQNRLPFNINYNNDVLNINLGNNIDLTFNLIWETKEQEDKVKKIPSIYYRLIKID